HQGSSPRAEGPVRDRGGPAVVGPNPLGTCERDRGRSHRRAARALRVGAGLVGHGPRRDPRQADPSSHGERQAKSAREGSALGADPRSRASAARVIQARAAAARPRWPRGFPARRHSTRLARHRRLVYTEALIMDESTFWTLVEAAKAEMTPALSNQPEILQK